MPNRTNLCQIGQIYAKIYNVCIIIIEILYIQNNTQFNRRYLYALLQSKIHLGQVH